MFHVALILSFSCILCQHETVRFSRQLQAPSKDTSFKKALVASASWRVTRVLVNLCVFRRLKVQLQIGSFCRSAVGTSSALEALRDALLRSTTHYSAGARNMVLVLSLIHI